MCAGPTTPGAKKAAQSLAQRPESRRSYQEFQRSRAKLLRSVSQRRAQSTAVDFRRVWWDKDRRGASRTGMSIWRPLPPTGYISLGSLPVRPFAAVHGSSKICKLAAPVTPHVRSMLTDILWVHHEAQDDAPPCARAYWRLASCGACAIAKTEACRLFWAARTF